jgi:serine phosphatase RsbU (regulator of sigma subunit)/DNA-binding LacI/PurR family transcriptional regulator
MVSVTDALARRPRRSGAPRVGVLLDSFYTPQNLLRFAGVRSELEAAGADMVAIAGGIVGQPGRTGAQRNFVFDLVSPATFDGLVVSGTVANHIGAAGLAEYCRRFQPLPMTTTAVELPGVPAVLVDNESGLRAAVRHLIRDHGLRRVAFVAGPEASREAGLRQAAYREVLFEHDIAWDPALVIEGDFFKPAGERAAEVLWGRPVGTRPQAIVAANDLMALGALESLQRQGVRVPDDVAVVGFDDIEAARNTSPALTSVRQPLFEQGQEAARLLLGLLDGRVVPERRVLDTEFVVRRSCGCLAEPLADTAAAEPAADTPALHRLSPAERDAMAETVRASLAEVHARVHHGWARQLIDRVGDELGGVARARGVLALVESLLHESVANGGSPRAWHAAVTALRACCLGHLRDPAARTRAEDLFHQMRVLVGEAAERAQVRQRLELEDWTLVMRDATEALASTLEPRALGAALCDQLPRLRVPFAVMAERVDGEATARLRVAFDGDRGLADPAGGALFPIHELVPAELWPARRLTCAIVPLFFEDQPYGHAVFEMGTVQPRVFERLRELISNATYGGRLLQRLVDEEARRHRAERARLEREMQIAAQIQTGVLPHALAVEGLDVAASMEPATEVGGDYYDVLPVTDGCWIGIGDVAGHGLPTGLMMLMIQSAVSALVRAEPQASPAVVLKLLNDVIYENVRTRMRQNEHATLTLLRYRADGTLRFAGAHEDLLIWRAATRTVERIETTGAWIGAAANIKRVTDDLSCRLEVGDVLLLYTDGVIEAQAADGHRFGEEHLEELFEAAAPSPVGEIRDRVLAAVRGFEKQREDDVTVVVVRRVA